MTIGAVSHKSCDFLYKTDVFFTKVFIFLVLKAQTDLSSSVHLTSISLVHRLVKNIVCIDFIANCQLLDEQF